MYRNKKLYYFLVEWIWFLIEKWYELVDKDSLFGVYVFNDLYVIDKVK